MKSQREALPSFGPKSDTGKEFGFQKEVDHLPFQFNMWDKSLNKRQDARIINLIYDDWDLFSQGDEGLDSVINYMTPSAYMFGHLVEAREYKNIQYLICTVSYVA